MSLANPQVAVGCDVIAIEVIVNVLFKLISTKLVCTGILRVKHPLAGIRVSRAGSQLTLDIFPFLNNLNSNWAKKVTAPVSQEN